MQPGSLPKLLSGAALAVSALGVAFIQSFEVSPGAPVPLVAYDDGVGVYTYCWGHTAGVKPGDRTTLADCERYLREDLAVAEAAVRKSVKVPLTQPMFDSLVSWTLNLGSGNLSRSTMLRRFNAGQYAEGCAEMLKWDRAGGRVLAGLTRRRKGEYQMCMTGVPDAT